jgi:hypothetical protein
MASARRRNSGSATVKTDLQPHSEATGNLGAGRVNCHPAGLRSARVIPVRLPDEGDCAPTLINSVPPMNRTSRCTGAPHTRFDIQESKSATDECFPAPSEAGLAKPNEARDTHFVLNPIWNVSVYPCIEICHANGVSL